MKSFDMKKIGAFWLIQICVLGCSKEVDQKEPRSKEKKLVHQEVYVHEKELDDSTPSSCIISLETCCVRYYEINDEYNKNYEQRNRIHEFLIETGEQEAYNRLKHELYPHMVFQDILDSFDGCVYKTNFLASRQVRQNAAQSFGDWFSFQENEIENGTVFWIKYTNVLWKSVEFIKPMIAAEEKKTGFSQFVLKQAYEEAKMGVLLERIYSPYFVLNTPDHNPDPPFPPK